MTKKKRMHQSKGPPHNHASLVLGLLSAIAVVIVQGHYQGLPFGIVVAGDQGHVLGTDIAMAVMAEAEAGFTEAVRIITVLKLGIIGNGTEGEIINEEALGEVGVQVEVRGAVQDHQEPERTIVIHHQGGELRNVLGHHRTDLVSKRDMKHVMGSALRRPLLEGMRTCHLA